MIFKMKGLKLCGLLLAFFTIFGLSFVGYSDTNALSYGVSSFNIGSDVYQFKKIYDLDSSSDVYSYFPRPNQFSISFTNNNPAPSGFTFPHTWMFTGNLDLSSNTCKLPSPIDTSFYSDGVTSSALTGYTIYRNKSFNFTFDASNLISDDSPFVLSSPLNFASGSWLERNKNAFCHIQDFPYNENSSYNAYIPSWDWSSLINIPLVNNRFEYEKSKPFTYNYNTIDLKRTEKVDGVVMSSDGLKMSDLFNVPVPAFGSMSMYFGFFDDITTDLSDSDWQLHEDVTTFSLKGSIEFDSDYVINDDITYNLANYYDPYFHSSSSTLNSFTYNDNTIYSLPFNPHSTSVDMKVCNTTEYHISNGDDSNRLDFECVYDPVIDGAFVSSVDFRYLSNFRLNFGRTGLQSLNTPTDFLSTQGDYKFTNFRLVTNNNETPSGWDATNSGLGGNPSSMPGNDGYDEDFEPDWFTSLKNMFGFNFLNPFAGIFTLFSDQNSCAAIPTLSSMIHSEETSVCPWFDSTTRNIVTPVLGLASVMLVFGFAVRWLGSSSGNLFEDSSSEDLANVNGSGWRRFKK